MVTQQENHNQAMLLINKLLGPNAASSVPVPPPPHLIPGAPPPLPPANNFGPYTPSPFPPYYPPAQPPPPLVPLSKTPEKMNYELPEQPGDRGRSSKSYKRKSHKRRYEETVHRPSKVSPFDALIASHGTSSANRKSRDSFNNDHSQKVMGKQIRDILSQPHKDRDTTMLDVEEKKDKLRKKAKKVRSEKSYTDLQELLSNDPVARKRRKIQEKVRSKRDSAIEAEGKPESVYDYMHFDPDKEALKKKTEKILSGTAPSEAKVSSRMDEIDATLKEIEKETNNDDQKEKQEPVVETTDNAEAGELPAGELPATVITPTADTEPKCVGIRGSLSRPPSPKPSEYDIKKVLDEMEEGELSDDEQEYNKLINDVETVAMTTDSTTETASVAVIPTTPVKISLETISPVKPQPMSTTPSKNPDISASASVMKKLNLNTVASVDPNSKPKSIPFLTTSSKEADNKEISILDDLAFLNSIKNKFGKEAAPPAPQEEFGESIEMKSKELIEQLLRQDKISKEKEKQRRDKEKKREKDKKERDRLRQEKRREKHERREKLEKDVSEFFSTFTEPAGKDYVSKIKTKTSKSSATSKLKKEFKSNFVKAAESLEGTLMKSTIDNSVLPAERQNEVEEFVETKEHRFDDGLVIQTSVKKVDDIELYQKNKPVRYDYSKVNAEYPEYAVAGAIIYRLNEKKQRLIHRVVTRVGKETALSFLFKTEEIEKNGGEMTAAGDRRKEPGGIFMGLLKKELPDDDKKYIFTVENELESTFHIARKKVQRTEKRKRYNKNRKENNLSNALTNALNLSSQEEVEEDPVVDYIPPANSVPLPFIPKPKRFELSFVKPVQKKEFIVVGEDKPIAPAATAKIEAMKKGYAAFVKKGTSTSANIFKPSVTAKMSEVPDLFDNLLRETSVKQKEVVPSSAGAPSTEVEMSEGGDTVRHAPHHVIGPALIPLVQPPPPPPDEDAALQNCNPLTSWDPPPPPTPPPAQPPSETTSTTLSVMKPLPDSRTTAILKRSVSRSGEDLSEGECSESDEEAME